MSTGFPPPIATALDHFNDLYAISMQSDDPATLLENHGSMETICDEVRQWSFTPHLDSEIGRTQRSNFAGQEQLVLEMKQKTAAVYNRTGLEATSPTPPLPLYPTLLPPPYASLPASMSLPPSFNAWPTSVYSSYPSLPSVAQTSSSSSTTIAPPSPKKATSMLARLKEKFFPSRTQEEPFKSLSLERLPTPSSIFHIPMPQFFGPPAPLDVGVGFDNASCNCWANALLQMVIQEPNLRKAYETVAEHYLKVTQKEWIGIVLNSALVQYDRCFTQQLTDNRPHSVPAEASQNVRQAFHELFKDSVTAAPAFSASQYQQEDAAEALVCLLGRYADILNPENETPENYPLFFFDLQTTRQFTPLGEAVVSDQTDGYSALDNNCFVETEKEFQVLLDLHPDIPMSFSELLNEYFHSARIAGSGEASYVVGENLLQRFAPIDERHIFLSEPSQLLLTLKRFGRSPTTGELVKVKNHVDVPFHLTLPASSTPSGNPVHYELSSFIVHRGSSIGSGHYLCYRKIEGVWYEFNDSRVAKMEESWILAILKESYIHQYIQVPASEVVSQSVSPTLPPLSSIPSIDPALEKYSSVIEILNGARSLDGLELVSALQAVARIEPTIVTQLEFFIWLHDGMPKTIGYGANILQTNPSVLKLITAPIILQGETASSLLEQTCELYQEKLEIARSGSIREHAQRLENRLIGRKLHAFSCLLEHTGFSNGQLSLAFAQLDIPAHYKQRIFQAIDPVYGEATMKDNPRHLLALKPSNDILGKLIRELSH